MYKTSCVRKSKLWTTLVCPHGSTMGRWHFAWFSGGSIKRRCSWAWISMSGLALRGEIWRHCSLTQALNNVFQLLVLLNQTVGSCTAMYHYVLKHFWKMFFFPRVGWFRYVTFLLNSSHSWNHSNIFPRTSSILSLSFFISGAFLPFLMVLLTELKPWFI